jgi:type III restriction enzyme
MLQRVMPDLMGMKNILVLNDEAHHCYREKPKEADDEDLKGDDRKEAEKNNEAARLWIAGLEAVNRKLGLARVIDLSATPFFLRGSGYAEGTLFPWTMSDFSLMDAIECGIVKLPRVPVAENIPGNEMPMFRNLWENIRKDMPKKGRGQGEELDPLKLPTRLQTALQALYGHYERHSSYGRKRASGFRRALSSSARTPPSPSSFMTSYRAFTGRTKTARPPWRMAAWRSSGTLTRSPATHCRVPTRC